MSRFFANSLFLALFCAAFYVMTVGITWLASGPGEKVVHERSFDRRKADQYWHQRKWEDAAGHYQQLTEQDPYNGNAWFFLAECYGNQRFDFVRKIYRAERRDTPNDEEIEGLMQQAKELGDKAIFNYKKATGFSRFTNRSRYSMARIMAFHGNDDEALQQLKIAVDDNYVCGVRGGLKNVYELRSLRELEVFEEICAIERENHDRKKGTLRRGQ